jgi:adenylosuccinate synthase
MGTKKKVGTTRKGGGRAKTTQGETPLPLHSNVPEHHLQMTMTRNQQAQRKTCSKSQGRTLKTTAQASDYGMSLSTIICAYVNDITPILNQGPRQSHLINQKPE